MSSQGPQPGKIRLGTASPATQSSTPETLKHLHHIARSAAAGKVDILVLPEAYIGGYPRGSSFGSVIGSRSAEGRDEFLAYWQSAVDLGDTVGDGAGAGEAWVSRELEKLAVGRRGLGNGGSGSAADAQALLKRGDGTREELERIASETGVFLVVGLIEKAGGSLYCAAVYVCPKMGIIGKRRKLMPTGTERLVWAQGSPATLQAVTTLIRGVRINMAAAICWESYMPLLRQSLYSQNINLYLAPTADNRDAWLSLMRTIGVEGRCFVVASNMCVRTPREETLFTTNGHNSAIEEAQGDAHPYDGSARARRNSAITEDGHEIALPKTGGRSTAGRRRKSIIDENGNEIVLSCNDNNDGEQAQTLTAAAAKTTATNRQAKTDKFISRGGSCIVNPFGNVLAGPQWEDDDGIIFADVDFKDCIRGRLDLDAAGSYSRNDSFQFSVRGLHLMPLSY